MRAAIDRLKWLPPVQQVPELARAGLAAAAMTAPSQSLAKETANSDTEPVQNEADGAPVVRTSSPRLVEKGEGPESPSDSGPSMVGAARFELTTTCTPSKCATRLRYAPSTASTRIAAEAARS